MVTTHIEEPADEVTTLQGIGDAIARTYGKANEKLLGPNSKSKITLFDVGLLVPTAFVIALAPLPWSVLGIICLLVMVIRTVA